MLGLVDGCVFLGIQDHEKMKFSHICQLTLKKNLYITRTN